MARVPAPGTRERILKVAAALFQDRGVRDVGLQEIVDRSRLGKNRFYREFGSKDDLVAAWLHDQDERWWVEARAATAGQGDDPARRIVDIIAFIYANAAMPQFSGCVFYNTANEFRTDDHPGHQEAVSHLRRLQEWMTQLAEKAGAPQPESLAAMLMLLIGGLLSNGAVLTPLPDEQTVLDTARQIIRTRCQPQERVLVGCAPLVATPLTS